MEKRPALLGRPEAAKELADVCVEMMVDAWGPSGRGRREEGAPRSRDGASSAQAASLFKTRHAAHVHFVGIGGIGMSGIAEVLLNLGYRVSGSDLKESEITRRLARLGAHDLRTATGRRTWSHADVVVISSAVRKDNPEVVAARQRKIPVIPRAEMLAELMRLKYAVAVAGSPRQDHHHLDGGHRARRRRAGPDRGGGRQGERPRLQRQAGQERADGGGGGRVRRQLPQAAPRPSRWSPTSTPSTWTTTARWTRSRPPSSSSATGCRSTASTCSAWTTPTCRRCCRASRSASSPTARAHTADYRLEGVRLDGLLHPLPRLPPRRGPRRVHGADGGRAQRAQRAGGHRRGRGDGHPARHRAQRAGRVRRRAAALHRAGRGERHHRGGRLRAPPGRGDGHARRRAPGLRPPRWWSPSSRTATRAPAICSQEFATAFNDADVLFVTGIYAAGEEPIPGVTGEALAEADPRPRAPRRDLRGEARGRCRGAAAPAARGRPGAHPGRRRHHPGGPGAAPAAGAGPARPARRELGRVSGAAGGDQRDGERYDRPGVAHPLEAVAVVPD